MDRTAAELGPEAGPCRWVMAGRSGDGVSVGVMVEYWRVGMCSGDITSAYADAPVTDHRVMAHLSRWGRAGRVMVSRSGGGVSVGVMVEYWRVGMCSGDITSAHADAPVTDHRDARRGDTPG
ncbi:hypothetical protein GCM10009626_16110 [Brachybacterium sacelli]